jgi:hypothetical protein
MQSKTDLGFTTGGHTTQAHGWLCKCSSGCGCVDGNNKPTILTAHVDGSSNTNGISTSNYNTLVDTLQSKVNSFVTTQRETGINSATTALESCSEERARLGEGVQDRLGSGELKLTTFLPSIWKQTHDSTRGAWNIDLRSNSDDPGFIKSFKVDGHYDFKWGDGMVNDFGITQDGIDEIGLATCDVTGPQDYACFKISVVNPDPFYGTSGMEFKRNDLEAVVNECLQADTIGGYKVLQALKLVGTSGNDDFLGTRKGFLDLTNGLPGTATDDVGTSTAKGMVIVYFLKVDGTPDGWSHLLSNGLEDTTGTCGNGISKFRIEGSETPNAYVCQVKAVVTLWRRSGGNTCSASTTPMVKVHAEVDHTQDNYVTTLNQMRGSIPQDFSTRWDSHAKYCKVWHRRRRRGPPGKHNLPTGETVMNLFGVNIADGTKDPTCKVSATSCQAAARKVDLHVRQKLNAARFDMIKDCSSDRRRVTLTPYKTTQPPTPSPPAPACCQHWSCGGMRDDDD